MNRQILRNLDGSVTVVEDDRSETIPAGASDAEVESAIAAFFMPVVPDEP